MTDPEQRRDDALRREAIRIYARYAVEVVEGLGFCPWAKPAREAGRVRVEPVLGAAEDLDSTLNALACLEAEPTVEIGLLVFPELNLDRVPFQHYAARVREGNESRWSRGEAPFAIADFHPNAPVDLSNPERLLPFIRRSPDPTLQLVRRSALQNVRLTENQGTQFVDLDTLMRDAFFTQTAVDPLHQRIARANHRTVERIGATQVCARLDDIARDRSRSYAQLGVPPASWHHGEPA